MKLGRTLCLVVTLLVASQSLAWAQTCTLSMDCTFPYPGCGSSYQIDCNNFNRGSCVCTFAENGDCDNCGYCFYTNNCYLRIYSCGKACAQSPALATSEAGPGWISDLASYPLTRGQSQRLGTALVQVEVPPNIPVRLTIGDLETSPAGLKALDYSVSNVGSRPLRAVTVQWQFFYGDKLGLGTLDVFDRSTLPPIGPGQELDRSFGAISGGPGGPVTRVVAEVTYAEFEDGSCVGPTSEQMFAWLKRVRRSLAEGAAARGGVPGVRSDRAATGACIGSIGAAPGSPKR